MSDDVDRVIVRMATDGGDRTMRSAVVVAGGRSERFDGTDKVVASLAGTPMIRRVVGRIRMVVDEVIVNCRADQVDSIRAALSDPHGRVGFAVDPVPDRGPAAGIRTGLRAVEGSMAVVVAADMPFVDPNVVEYLFGRLDGVDAVVPRLGDGWLQPLQAVYRVDPTIDACDRVLDAGDASVTDVLDVLEYEVVDEHELPERASARSFENVNTREELEAARRRIE